MFLLTSTRRVHPKTNTQCNGLLSWPQHQKSRHVFSSPQNKTKEHMNTVLLELIVTLIRFVDWERLCENFLNRLSELWTTQHEILHTNRNAFDFFVVVGWLCAKKLFAHKQKQVNKLPTVDLLWQWRVVDRDKRTSKKCTLRHDLKGWSCCGVGCLLGPELLLKQVQLCAQFGLVLISYVLIYTSLLIIFMGPAFWESHSILSLRQIGSLSPVQVFLKSRSLLVFCDILIYRPNWSRINTRTRRYGLTTIFMNWFNLRIFYFIDVCRSRWNRLSLIRQDSNQPCSRPVLDREINEKTTSECLPTDWACFVFHLIAFYLICRQLEVWYLSDL